MTETCPKCNGRGTYFYDDKHGKICEVCCSHDLGWWQLGLGPGCGDKAGKWACMRGCGTVREENPDGN